MIFVGPTFGYHANVRLSVQAVLWSWRPPDTRLFHRDVRQAWFSVYTFAWCEVFESFPGVKPQLYTDNLKCVSGYSAALLRAARFTNLYIGLVGQEAAPEKCVFLSTSWEVSD